MQEQTVERIHDQLDWTVCHLQQYLWKQCGDSAEKRRMRVDAALIAALTIVSELLPDEVQAQVKQMVTLHDEACRLGKEPGSNTPPSSSLPLVEEANNC